IPLLVHILLLILWQLFSWVGIIPDRILPAPSAVFQAGISLMITGELFTHLSASLWRALIGFLIGGGIGCLLGLFNLIFRFSGLLFDSSVLMLIYSRP